MQKKKKGQVQTRERNPNWTKEEDEALCRAWLRIPENPTDTDYTGDGIEFEKSLLTYWVMRQIGLTQV